MISSEVAKRYAVGLFELAVEKNILDQVAGELVAISDVCKKDKTLLNFLAAPQIRDQEKEQVLNSVFTDRVSKPVKVFLDLVVRKRRSQYLIDICEAFNDLVLEKQGYVKTKVTTAIKLSDKEIKALQAKLEKKTGKQVLMTTRVQPEILGGVIVQLGNQVIDNSVKHELRLLRDKLLELKVN